MPGASANGVHRTGQPPQVSKETEQTTWFLGIVSAAYPLAPGNSQQSTQPRVPHPGDTLHLGRHADLYRTTACMVGTAERVATAISPNSSSCAFHAAICVVVCRSTSTPNTVCATTSRAAHRSIANHFRLEQHFVRIETDEGPIGIAGPLPDMVAAFVAKRLRPIILGQDPDRAREAVGPDAPDHGARPPGRRDAGDQRGRLRAVGSEGTLARPAGVPPAWRPDARHAFPPTPRCWGSRCGTWAACARAPLNTRRWAIRRRNGSSATAR